MTDFLSQCGCPFGRIVRDTLRSSLPATRILIAFLVLPLFPALASAQSQPALEWELVNPFRFIQDQRAIDELKQVYDSLPETNKTAFALEEALQSRADRAVDAIRADARSRYDCDHTKKDAEKHQCFAPYLGWFAKLAANDHAATCWDSKNFMFRDEGPCENYVYPSKHRVRVSIAGAETLGANIPTWILQPAVDFSYCGDTLTKRCIEFDVPYHIDQSDQISVAAQLPDRTLTIAPIQVTDKLIVGLGDSYAAGDGNT